MRRWVGALTLWVLLLIVLSPTTWAHSLNMTGVKVRFETGRVTVSVVAHAHILQSSNASAEIARRLHLRIGDKAFVPADVQLLRDPANGIVMWQAEGRLLPREKAPQVTLEAPIFPEVAGQSTVLTLIRDNRVVSEALLNTDHPSATIGGTNAFSGSQVAGRFVREGIGHIFGGIDHILFLLSLLLLGGSWRQLLKIVTAFTLAHSITLSLAATGVFALPPRFVEPVIALSIVVVALSNLRHKPVETGGSGRDWRPYMAFGFGLIHGFGFAGALAEVGLPREALAWALVAFNLGVEIGQAALVIAFAPLLGGLVRQWPPLQKPVVRFGSATVALVGTLWFVQRIWMA